MATLDLPTLDQISVPLLLLGLFFTAGLLILLRGWRMSLLALLVQYFVLGLWLAKLYRPEMLLLKTLTGAVVVAMTYLVAAEAQWGTRRSPPAPDDAPLGDGEVEPPTNLPPSLLVGPGFRLTAVVLAFATAYGLTINYPLPDLGLDVNLAFYWLCTAGLVCLMISRDAVYAGLGVLCLISSLDLFYVAMVDIPDVVILGLLAGMSLFAALVVARSTDAATAAMEADRQGDAA